MRRIVQSLRSRNKSGITALAAMMLACGVMGSSLSSAETLPQITTELLQLVRNEIDALAPAVSTDLRETRRQELLASLQRVENRLHELPDAIAWRSYLKMEQLARLAQSTDTLDETQLAECSDALRCAVVVWPSKELETLRVGLEHFAQDARISLDPNYQWHRRSRLQALSTVLAEDGRLSDPGTLRQVFGFAGWLRERGDANALVDALETHLLRPNIILTLSQEALSDQGRMPIDQEFPINQVYVGTFVTGSGENRGTVTLQLADIGNRGAVDLMLDARTLARTSGSNTGVWVTSSSHTWTRGVKRIFFEPGGLSTAPASANATSRVELGATQQRWGPLAAIASGRVQANRGSAEAQSAADAERQAKTQLDEFAGQAIAKFNDEYRRAIVYPLTGRYVWPRKTTSRVVGGQLRLEALQADGSECGPAAPPPQTAEPMDAALQVHATAIERIALGMLAGRTLAGSEVGRFLAQFNEAARPSTPTSDRPATSNDSLPAHAPAEDAAGDWGLTFDARQPLAVELEAGRVSVVLRLSQFESEGKVYPATKVRIGYRLLLEDDAARFVRDEAISAWPLDFAPGTGQRLTGPQQVMCKTLSRRLGSVVAREYVLRSLFDNEAFSRLRMTVVSVQQGWLTIGMQQRDPPHLLAF